MSRHILFAIALLGLLGLGAPVASATDTCITRDEKGVCIDNPNVPVTGTYTTLEQMDGVKPAGVSGSQYHGAVRLTDDSYIYAYNYCRYVDNFASKGKGLYIPLGTAAEWASFRGQNPSGSSVIQCCRPVTVTICGQNKSANWTKVGGTKTFTAGYNRKIVLTCDNDVDDNTDGLVPTADTSWNQAVSGQCAEPPQSSGCSISNDKDWCNSQSGGGSGDADEGKSKDGYHDKGGEGPNGQGNF